MATSIRQLRQPPPIFIRMILRTLRKTSEPQAAPRASDRSPQADDNILALTPYSEEEVRSLEERVLLGDEPEQCTRTPLPASHHNEDDRKDSDQIGSTAITTRTNPTPSSYVPPTRRTLSHKMRVGSVRSEISQTNQITHPSWLKNLVAKTNVL